MAVYQVNVPRLGWLLLPEAGAMDVCPSAAETHQSPGVGSRHPLQEPSALAGGDLVYLNSLRQWGTVHIAAP